MELSLAGKRILLLIGGEYHPFEAFTEFFTPWASQHENTELVVTKDRACFTAPDLERFDMVVTYTQGGTLTPAQEAGLVRYVREGGLFVGIHGATASWKDNAEYIAMLGGVFVSHGPVGPVAVTINDALFPVEPDTASFEIVDELYVLDRFSAADVTVFATAPWEGKSHPMAYVKAYGEGRVFYLALGHDERAFAHPQFQYLLAQGMAWTLQKAL